MLNKTGTWERIGYLSQEVKETKVASWKWGYPATWNSMEPVATGRLESHLFSLGHIFWCFETEIWFGCLRECWVFYTVWFHVPVWILLPIFLDPSTVLEHRDKLLHKMIHTYSSKRVSVMPHLTISSASDPCSCKVGSTGLCLARSHQFSICILSLPTHQPHPPWLWPHTLLPERVNGGTLDFRTPWALVLCVQCGTEDDKSTLCVFMPSNAPANPCSRGSCNSSRPHDWTAPWS